jgi:hypothetical protein
MRNAIINVLYTILAFVWTFTVYCVSFYFGWPLSVGFVVVTIILLGARYNPKGARISLTAKEFNALVNGEVVQQDGVSIILQDIGFHMMLGLIYNAEERINQKLPLKPTARGFSYGTFLDRNGEQCSIQKSSIATEDAIWLGVDDARPQIMASQAKQFGVKTDETTGWVPFPIPEEVVMSTRMHLTRDQVELLLPTLHRFVETGELE